MTDSNTGNFYIQHSPFSAPGKHADALASLPDDALNEEQLVFFDRIALLSRAPDEHVEKLRNLYVNDERFRVPSGVFNALRNRTETLTAEMLGSERKESAA